MTVGCALGIFPMPSSIRLLLCAALSSSFSAHAGGPVALDGLECKSSVFPDALRGRSLGNGPVAKQEARYHGIGFKHLGSENAGR